MPRNTSRSRSGSKASKVPSFQKRNSHTPASSQGQRQPQPQQTSSFGEAVKSGIGLGIGMEAVRGVVGALSGSTGHQQQHEEHQQQHTFTGIHENDNTKSICDTYHSDLLTCLKDNKINCETLFLQYKDCLMNQLS